jgi:hypothetical protein
MSGRQHSGAKSKWRSRRLPEAVFFRQNGTSNDKLRQTCFPELGLERTSRLGKIRSLGSSDDGRPGGKEATASQDATATTRSRVGWFLK